MRISDWSPDVCSSDLHRQVRRHALARRDALIERLDAMVDGVADDVDQRIADILHHLAIQLDLATAGAERDLLAQILRQVAHDARQRREQLVDALRSEEHTSELQSLMRISYAVFCLKKKKLHT